LCLQCASFAEPAEAWRTSFYDYVNADWTESHPIPADKGTVGSFSQVSNETEQELKTMFEELAGKAKLNADETRLLNLYKSYTDLSRREELGLKPIAADLALIAGCKSHRDIALAMSQFLADMVSLPLLPYVIPDRVDSNKNRLNLFAAGTSLTKDDFADTPAAGQKREAYRQMLVKLFSAADLGQSELRAERAIAVEKALTTAQMPIAETRNPEKTNNPLAFAEVVRRAPNLLLEEQFKKLELTEASPINLIDPKFLTWYNDNFPKISVESWQDYLRARVLQTYSDVLTTEISDITTEFVQAIGLAQEEPPLWSRGIDYAEGCVSMLVGKVYVERFFDEKDKQAVEAVIRNIQEQARIAITNSPDLGPETRAHALEKLAKMTFQIGYPERWEDYSRLTITADDPAGNKRRSANFDFELNRKKLLKPVDRKEFSHSPHEVNAFYTPMSNSFVILAGILKPPFFDPKGGDAALYGGLGFVVGHEIGHAFDDTGRYYDGDGNLSPWWEPADLERFQKKKEALIAQANGYEIIPGLALNGPLESGEIIGDLTGSEFALGVFERIIKEKGLDRQQALKDFFFYQAQVWRETSRDGVLRNKIQTDPHPPGKYRTDGILRNVDSFYEVFPLKPGDPMYLAPEQRVTIW
jgi:predicted metalloendopeptidase